MESPDIENTIIEIISKDMSLSESEINLSSRFLDDLGMDSLDEVELVMWLEEEFKIMIPDEAAKNCRTVREAIGLVSKILNEQEAS